ncbi:hypothetical protein [Caulobacter sp. CCG-8]|uniref:hypothetical protein n=1 Tax=Caulobacter sp. CCG-8 TaxID=3127958 RepID=UPI00307E93CA
MIARQMPGLPPYGGEVKSFPRPDAFREGLVVEFTPDGAERWIGNFARGSKPLEAVHDAFGDAAVLLVAGGDVYVVDARERRVVRAFPEVSDVRFEADLGVFLIADDLAVTALGPAGVAWRSRRVSWDGITDLERRGMSLHGLAVDIHDQPPVPFIIDLQSGHASGGSYPRELGS